jgi:hypothetical protein
MKMIGSGDRRAAWVLAQALAACLIALSSTGCSGGSDEPTFTGSVVPPIRPGAPELSTPEAAVRSYTDWISYAYRILDSDVATHAFSEWEEVRVNSYVQYNKIEGRAIEQSLVTSEYDRAKSTDSTATIVGKEYWRYRYIAADGSKYLTGPLDASYDVTYTVVRKDVGTWLVDRVEVNRLDEKPGSDEELKE